MTVQLAPAASATPGPHVPPPPVKSTPPLSVVIAVTITVPPPALATVADAGALAVPSATEPNVRIVGASRASGADGGGGGGVPPPELPAVAVAVTGNAYVPTPLLVAMDT